MKKNTCLPAAGVAALAYLLATPIQAQPLAFPGAYGFGANATGGRGGAVYHVVNTNDSGTGSFRDAVSQPNRTIVFDVGGYIVLSSAVACADNLTIAGQTAPGDGIGLMGHELSFSSKNNEIVRFLRIRPGSIASSGEDGINMGDGTNMIYDHISIEFAPYNNIDAAGGGANSHLITIQNSILADPIGQQFNAHTEASNHDFAWCYNILSSGHNRNPLAKINTIYLNNVIYNFQAGYTVADTGGNFSHDLVNNYFISGPSTSNAGDDFFQMDANQSVYASGNLLDGDKNGSLGGATTSPGGVTALSSPWSSLTPNIPTYSTASAFRHDVSLAGVLPHDQVDQDVLADVTSLGTSGRMWTSQTANGLGNNGYGVINGGTAPLDTDQDGMPDYWENALGLNPNDASDGNTIGADGYTHLEEYLNWLAGAHVAGFANTNIDLNLSQYAGGFVTSPAFTVASAAHGSVSVLADGHTARFVPTAGYYGLASYDFTVTDSAGSTMTLTVAVLVQPAPPATPTGLAATAGDAQVALAWNASAGATGYPLYRATSGSGPYALLAAPVTTAYTDAGLTNGTLYFYSVAASNLFGRSALSAYVGATPTNPATPTAKPISINFVGNGTNLAVTESAGVVAETNWNNVIGTNGSNLALHYVTGAASGATLTWSANHNSAEAVTNALSNYRMMNGYINTATNTTTTIAVAGLPADANGYKLYVYAEENTSGATRVAAYKISGAGITTTTISATDPNTFAGTFTQASDSTGNYVVFTLGNVAGFTLTATPVSASDGILRAPVNGLQLIPQ